MSVETGRHDFIDHVPGFLYASSVAMALREAEDIIESPKDNVLSGFFEITRKSLTTAGVESGYINIDPKKFVRPEYARRLLEQLVPGISSVASQLESKPSKYGKLTRSHSTNLTLNYAPFGGETTPHIDAETFKRPHVGCVASLCGVAEFWAKDREGNVFDDYEVTAGDAMYLYNPKYPERRLLHGADVIDIDDTSKFGRVSLGFLVEVVPNTEFTHANLMQKELANA